MKKILASILALVSVTALAFSLASCNETTTSESQDKPIEFTYSLDSDNDYYVLTGVKLSDEAQTLVTKKDFTALATLLSTPNETTGYTPYATDLTAETVREFTIPTTYKEKEVKEIASEAIVNQNFIKKLTVTAIVEKINAGAFAGLTSLEEITLPFVGEKVNAFNEKKSFGYIFGTTSATGLTAVTQTYNEGTSSTATFQIPSTLKTVTVTGSNEENFVEKKYDIEDGKYVFNDDGEYSVFVDEGTYAVPAYSFYNCSMLTTINLTGTIEKIPDFAFYGCSSLKNYVLSDETTKIGNSAFYGCSALQSLDFNKVDEIGESAFVNCSSLGKAYADSDNVVTVNATVIGKDAFHGLSGLTKVVFTNCVTIGKMAFHECSSLEEIVFEVSSVIGESAFAGCENLATAELRNSEIGNNAFYGTKLDL